MTLSSQIIEVLDALCNKFGLAIDWTSENVIPYVTTLFDKLVSFEIWSSVVYIVSALMLVIAWLIFLKRTWADKHNDIDYAIPVEIFSVFLFIGAGALVLAQTIDIVKCITFPELFVYEYVLIFIENVH